MLRYVYRLRDEGSGVWNMRKVIVPIFRSLILFPPPPSEERRGTY